jgi:hypothetical protein
MSWKRPAPQVCASAFSKLSRPSSRRPAAVWPSCRPCRAWKCFGNATQGGADYVSLALGWYVAAPLALRPQRESARMSVHKRFRHSGSNTSGVALDFAGEGLGEGAGFAFAHELFSHGHLVEDVQRLGEGWWSFSRRG